MTWPELVPILFENDITNSSTFKIKAPSPKSLGAHMLSTFSRSEMNEVHSAVARAHAATLHIPSSNKRTALVFNVAMAYLGYTEGQSNETLRIARTIRPYTVAELQEFERHKDACKKRSLLYNSGKPRTGVQRIAGRNMRFSRYSTYRVPENGG